MMQRLSFFIIVGIFTFHIAHASRQLQECPSLSELVQLYPSMRDISCIYPAGTPTQTIPSQIAQLNNLRSIEISCAQPGCIQGSIPSELGQLKQLRSLNLISTTLTGTIPPEIGNITTLHTLHIENAQLSGPIPPELFLNLVSLNLANNQLTGVLPSQINPELSYCGVQRNKLSGEVPTVFQPESENRQFILLPNDFVGDIAKGTVYTCTTKDREVPCNPMLIDHPVKLPSSLPGGMCDEVVGCINPNILRDFPLYVPEGICRDGFCCDSEVSARCTACDATGKCIDVDGSVRQFTSDSLLFVGPVLAITLLIGPLGITGIASVILLLSIPIQIGLRIVLVKGNLAFTMRDQLVYKMLSLLKPVSMEVLAIVLPPAVFYIVLSHDLSVLERDFFACRKDVTSGMANWRTTFFFSDYIFTSTCEGYLEADYWVLFGAVLYRTFVFMCLVSVLLMFIRFTNAFHTPSIIDWVRVSKPDMGYNENWVEMQANEREVYTAYHYHEFRLRGRFQHVREVAFFDRMGSKLRISAQCVKDRIEDWLREHIPQPFSTLLLLLLKIVIGLLYIGSSLLSVPMLFPVFTLYTYVQTIMKLRFLRGRTTIQIALHQGAKGKLKAFLQQPFPFELNRDIWLAVSSMCVKTEENNSEGIIQLQIEAIKVLLEHVNGKDFEPDWKPVGADDSQSIRCQVQALGVDNLTQLIESFSEGRTDEASA